MHLRARRCGLAACLSLLLIACDGDNPLSTAQLESVPDSHLYFPGSRVVDVNAVAQRAQELNNPSQDGFVSTTLTAPASDDALLSWYRSALARQGWSYRTRELHGEINNGHAVPPAYLFTRGTQEAFSLAIDPIAGDYIVTYIALIGHCDTKPPYPLEAGSCSDGKPQ